MKKRPRRPGSFRRLTTKEPRKPREASDVLERIDAALADRPEGFWPVVLIAYDPKAGHDPIVLLGPKSHHTIAQAHHWLRHAMRRVGRDARKHANPG